MSILQAIIKPIIQPIIRGLFQAEGFPAFAPLLTTLRNHWGGTIDAEVFSVANRTIIDDTGILQAVPDALHSFNRGRLSGGVYFNTHSDGSQIHPHKVVDGVRVPVTYRNHEVGLLYAPKARVNNGGNWYSTVAGGTDAAAFGDTIVWVLGGTHFNDYFNLVEGAVQNKCTNYNANPPALVAMTDAATFNAATTNLLAFDGGAGATFGIVDDSAALAAAGLDAICINGYVVKVDNSAGSASAGINILGDTGNTNPHSVSAWCRVDAADTGRLTLTSSASPISFTNTAFERVLQENETPADTARKVQINAAVGNVVYFILNQLEEAPIVSSEIVTAGAAATRGEMLGVIQWDDKFFNQPENTTIADICFQFDSGDIAAAARAVLTLDDSVTSFLGQGAGGVNDIVSNDSTNTVTAVIDAFVRGDCIRFIDSRSVLANEMILSAWNMSSGDHLIHQVAVPYDGSTPSAGLAQIAKAAGGNNLGVRTLMNYSRALSKGEKEAKFGHHGLAFSSGFSLGFN